MPRPITRSTSMATVETSTTLFLRWMCFRRLRCRIAVKLKEVPESMELLVAALATLATSPSPREGMATRRPWVGWSGEYLISELDAIGLVGARPLESVQIAVLILLQLLLGVVAHVFRMSTASAIGWRAPHVERVSCTLIKMVILVAAVRG